MYNVEKERVIIKNSSNKMSSSDVNEATATLKGMLGIGSNTPSKKSETVASLVKEEPSFKVKEEQPSNKKKKNKKPKKKKQNVSPKENKPNVQTNSTEGSEKFAWSAFQASPDASSLPIPAFSLATTKPTVDVSGLTTSVPEERSDIADTSRSKDSVVEEKIVEEPPVQEEEAALVSKTGINLAALAASPPSHTSINSTPRHTTPSQVTYEPPIHHHAPHYPQPPHLMTIQVQVPPVLMPGRQMVVTSPMGYPVQVTVPEGVPAGMVIPVNVPAYRHPAPHMMPGPAPPPHMMPPGPGPPPHMRPGPYPPYGYHPPPS
jgi:hypothetical protein